MIPIRLRQASLLLFAMLISVVAFYQMFLRVYGHFPANYIGLLAVVGAHPIIHSTLSDQHQYCNCG